MRFAAIIFDFDGVIADSEVRANQSLAESLTAVGMPSAASFAWTLSRAATATVYWA